MFLAKWRLVRTSFNGNSFLAKDFKFYSTFYPLGLKVGLKERSQSAESGSVIPYGKFIVTPLSLKAIKTGEK